MISRPLGRRDFLRALSLTPAAIIAACSESSGPRSTTHRLAARRVDPTTTTAPGEYDLNIEPGIRDGFFYVPTSYSEDTPAPLLVLLHGAGRTAEEWRSDELKSVADSLGFIAMAPSSRNPTWDVVITGRYGADVTFIDTALAQMFTRCNIDATRIALSGFSDGASYALSLGASNGDLFTHLLGFSPGFWFPAEKTGRPPVFITHGDNDQVLPVNGTRNGIVPEMRNNGYDVEYTEFAGGHTLSLELFTTAADWFVNGPAPAAPRESLALAQNPQWISAARAHGR